MPSYFKANTKRQVYMKRTDLNPALVIQQYYELRSCKNVADLYGCSGETISRVLKENGVKLTGWKVQEKPKQYRFKSTEESETLAIDVYQTTHSVADVCEAVNCSSTAVYKILQKHGISLRSKAWINSQRADEVAAYYVQGHSVRETAEKFNVSAVQINNLAKKRKISNGKDWREAGIEHQKTEAILRLSESLAEIGFEYVDGYTDKDCKVIIRCCTCGAEFEKTYSWLRKGNVICPECRKRESLARQEEKKRIAKQNADVKQVERLWYKLTHPPKNPYDEQHEAFLNRSGICEICGKPYTVREYVESCGLKKAQDNGVCSDVCRQKKKKAQRKTSHKGRRDSHRHRATKFGCEFDSSVTLQKLIKRKGLRCAICGEMCDPNDHSWSEYCGPMYPSIDHIIPMSKGGGHTWENVQVAHIICNSEKGDKLEAVI